MNLIILCGIRSSTKNKKQVKKRDAQKSRVATITIYPSHVQTEKTTISTPAASIAPGTDPVCSSDDVSISMKQGRRNEKYPKLTMKCASQKRCQLATVSQIIDSRLDSRDIQTEMKTISKPIANFTPGTKPCSSTDDTDLGTKHDRRKEKLQKQMTLMTVVMTTAFLFCITPFYIRALFLTFYI